MTDLDQHFQSILERLLDEKLPALVEEKLRSAVEPFVDAKVAAEHLSVKVATLRYWASVNYKDIPVSRPGGAVRFKLSELEEWSKRKVA